MSSTEGRYDLYSQGSTGWSIFRNEEFQEEDVWGILRERKEFNSNSSFSKESSTFTSRRITTAARMIAKSNGSFINEPKIVQHSAPVNIPDWSKIYGISTKKASNNTSWLDDDDDDDHGSNDGIMNNSWDSDEEEEDGHIIPPHEWIAKRLARSQISSFSVCEGVGRTLKGRDLSNVRNAVLTKTGFLE